MPWPLSQDYNEAIQSPDSSFADSELRGGQAVTNALGMPMPRSGNFADVYEFIGASGTKWAVKCFTREVPGRQERYEKIDLHLLKAKLPFAVGFQYQPGGIRIRGQWYPILKMQWVEGLLLNEFIRANLHKPAMLEGLAQIWVRMARRMRDADMAHADLQHGNVLLIPGRKEGSLAVKLIDYDGMWVPALASTQSGEVGHPAYQHPLRLQQGTYNVHVDRVPLLVVACALRCLVAGGKALWDRHDNGDNLLFREADLKSPDTSALFKELLQTSDTQARTLVQELHSALQRKLEDAPLIDELLPETKAPREPVVPSTAMQAGEPPVAAEPSVNDTSFQSTESKRKEKARPSGLVWALLAAGGAAVIVGGALLVAVGLYFFLPRQNGKGKDAPKKDGIAVVKDGKKVIADGKEKKDADKRIDNEPKKDGPIVEPRDPNEKNPPLVPGMFVPLFNGQDLTGWKTNRNVPGDWRVVNGVLTGSSSITNTLYTVRDDYKDFHLRAEACFRVTGFSQAGWLKCRTPFVVSGTAPAYEVTMYDGAKKTGGLNVFTRNNDFPTGLRSSIKGTTVAIAPGEWFTLDVRAEGNRITVKVNGATTVDLVDQKKQITSGHIALFPWPKAVLEFRKIEINELTPGAAPPVDPSLLAKPIELTLEKGQATHKAELLASDPLYQGAKKHYKLFLVPMEAGKTYQIDMNDEVKGNFDPYLYLEDSDGILLAQDDDGGGFLDSRIVWKATRTGKYRIIATHLNPTRIGRFTLNIDQIDLGPLPQASAPDRLDAEIKEAFLSDCATSKQQVGWFQPRRNHVPDANFVLSVGGQRFGRGLYAHAPSLYQWDLGGKWKSTEGKVGIQNPYPGSVVFVVRGDGKELWRSKLITANMLVPFGVNVVGVNQLELNAEDAGNGNAADWALWLEPKVRR